MKRKFKMLNAKFAIIVLLILGMSWILSCETKEVGPNTPPEFTLEAPPELPGVTAGSVDFEPVQKYQGTLQAAIDAGEVTPEAQALLDTFEILIGQEDLDYLADLDSSEVDAIGAEVDSTGELPPRIASIFAKLSSWGYLPIVTEASVSSNGASTSLRKTEGFNSATGPYEDCVDLVDLKFQQKIDELSLDHDDCLASGSEQEADCRQGRAQRYLNALNMARAFCSFAPSFICRIVMASYRMQYWSDIYACRRLAISTRNACNSAYNQSIAILNAWRTDQIDICHQSFGG